ncbi:MAG: tetratricopeptide repeat protein, partial [Rhodospirillaceae bacterium]
DFPEALVNLGMVRRAQGRMDDSVACFEQALHLLPAYPDALNSLGLTLHAMGRTAEAIARYRDALGLRPDFADALNNLGLTLHALGDLEAAVSSYRQAVRCRAGFADALTNLGNALRDMGQVGEALACHHEALRAEPGSVAALNNLGGVLREQGRIDEAVAQYRQSLVLRPDYGDALSNLLFALNGLDTLTPEALFEEHRRLGAELEARALAGVTCPAHTSHRDPERRLRIGYVSPDFRFHSVSQFLLPLLAAHDRAAVEIFCYAGVMVPDAMTERLRGHAEHWLTTVGLSDEALAARIRADGIDILVDLAGHTAHNRLPVLARRPAPVQVSWLGYPNTTGLRSIGYRFVDAVTDPGGTADALATETLIRLDGGFLCYGPPEEAPEPAPPPCLDRGVVTFGSFNNLSKLQESTLETWAAQLLRLPRARLLLKGQAFADAGSCALIRERFARRGIEGGRIDLVARIPDAAGHLGAYGRIDIALDSFPYNGTTTTCEALWMGVPVVTLLGDRHAGRVGASLLGRLGLDELIGRDRDHYQEIAVALA